jgi:hypothetical protein
MWLGLSWVTIDSRLNRRGQSDEAISQFTGQEETRSGRSDLDAYRGRLTRKVARPVRDESPMGEVDDATTSVLMYRYSFTVWSTDSSARSGKTDQYRSPSNERFGFLSSERFGA